VQPQLNLAVRRTQTLPRLSHSPAAMCPPFARHRDLCHPARLDRDLILAIDNGTQVLRALLFDPQGYLLAQCANLQ
jgi:hypothetical protein